MESPLVTIDGGVVDLARVEYANEAELRDLIAANPGLLPIRHIAPRFGGQLVTLGTECSTPAGPMDVLLMNDQGLLTIVETKLVKNPEQKRTVLAQCLEYVLSLPSRYDAYEAYLRKHLGDGSATLHGQFGRGDDSADLLDFRDAVEEGLRERRVLVLIVGDGFKSRWLRRLADMAKVLQRAVSTEAVFSLLEIAPFEGRTARGVVRAYAPTVHMKTEVVGRTVIRIEDERGQPVAARVESIERTQAAAKSGGAKAKAAITDEAFRAQLARAGAVTVWDDFIERLPEGFILDRKPTQYKVVLDVPGASGDQAVPVPILYLHPDAKVRFSNNAQASWEKTELDPGPLNDFLDWLVATFPVVDVSTSSKGYRSYRLDPPGLAGKEAETLLALRRLAMAVAEAEEKAP